MARPGKSPLPVDPDSGFHGRMTAHPEFNLPHGEMLRLLRSQGFTVEDPIELQAPRPSPRDYPEVTAQWAHHWPARASGRHG